ncbi:hypothetical protein ACJX0J_037891, partial [Zea mays]
LLTAVTINLTEIVCTQFTLFLIINKEMHITQVNLTQENIIILYKTQVNLTQENIIVLFNISVLNILLIYAFLVDYSTTDCNIIQFIFLMNVMPVTVFQNYLDDIIVVDSITKIYLDTED